MAEVRRVIKPALVLVVSVCIKIKFLTSLCLTSSGKNYDSLTTSLSVVIKQFVFV